MEIRARSSIPGRRFRCRRPRPRHPSRRPRASRGPRRERPTARRCSIPGPGPPPDTGRGSSIRSCAIRSSACGFARRRHPSSTSRWPISAIRSRAEPGRDLAPARPAPRPSRPPRARAASPGSRRRPPRPAAACRCTPTSAIHSAAATLGPRRRRPRPPRLRALRPRRPPSFRLRRRGRARWARNRSLTLRAPLGPRESSVGPRPRASWMTRVRAC